MVQHGITLSRYYSPGDKGYEVQRMAKDKYNQMELSFGDEGYIQYLKTSTIRWS